MRQTEGTVFFNQRFVESEAFLNLGDRTIVVPNIIVERERVTIVLFGDGHRDVVEVLVILEENLLDTRGVRLIVGGSLGIGRFYIVRINSLHTFNVLGINLVTVNVGVGSGGHIHLQLTGERREHVISTNGRSRDFTGQADI